MLPANFNQMYYFWIIAKEGSISLATNKLFLTQSTLSVQLKKLEKSLGQKLLVRSRQGVSLTNEGRLVFEYCERVFGQAEEFVRRLKEKKPVPPPSLRLGLSPAISHNAALRVLNFLSQSGFKNRIQVYSGPTEELKSRLVHHKVDLIVSEADASDSLGSDFGAKLVAKLPLWFMGNSSWRARIKRFPFDLGGANLLLRTTENAVRKQIDHFLFQYKIVPAVVAEVESVDLIRQMLLIGNGVAALDAVSAAKELAAKKLFKLHAKPLPFTQHVWIVYRRHHREEPSLQKAIDIVLDTFDLSP